MLKPVSLMIRGPPTPPLYLLLMFVVFSLSLLFTQLISSAFSLTLSHFCTSLLLLLLSPSYMLSFTELAP